MILIALTVSVYAGFIAVWRHDPSFEPGPAVYFVTGVLLLTAIIICYIGHLNTREA